ncbi:hypothetical protein SBA6_170002 [Candidatus Sulfopaludibacter sp. SbA6]|nr:hypothetical protein SBA6_170002 [Candidatus Sulfopaludibacter sp. SbA6]
MDEETNAEKRGFDEGKGFAGDVTVYFRYAYVKDEASYLGDVHYGHRVVLEAEDLESAIDLVMAEERASMVGHTGDRGIVEFLYATNGVDPKKGLWLWRCEEAK